MNRFGVIRKSIMYKSVYTLEKFKSSVLGAFGNDPKVKLVYISAIFDFKKYYDHNLLTLKSNNINIAELKKHNLFSVLIN